MIRKEEKKLYRKEKKTGLCRHDSMRLILGRGGDFRHERNTKEMKNFEGTFKPMNSKNLGYDYTPLYRFLLSKVGCNWDEVHSEAIKRLDKEEPIFDMVLTNPLYKRGLIEIVQLAENSYWSGLTIKDNVLVKINPDAVMDEVYCPCCTHTFNGKVIQAKFSPHNCTTL